MSTQRKNSQNQIGKIKNTNINILRLQKKISEIPQLGKLTSKKSFHKNAKKFKQSFENKFRYINYLYQVLKLGQYCQQTIQSDLNYCFKIKKKTLDQ